LDWYFHNRLKLFPTLQFFVKGLGFLYASFQQGVTLDNEEIGGKGSVLSLVSAPH